MLRVCREIDEDFNGHGKSELKRIVWMLTRLIQRTETVAGDRIGYRDVEYEYEPNAETWRAKKCTRVAGRAFPEIKVSWWMRLVCQRIGTRANREDGMSGKFWEWRFRAVRMLDETASLACSIYIGVNQKRAAIAGTLTVHDRFQSEVRGSTLPMYGIPIKTRHSRGFGGRG